MIMANEVMCTSNVKAKAGENDIISIRNESI